MTSKGNAQHNAALRMSAPASALEEGDREGGAVDGGEVAGGRDAIIDDSRGRHVPRG